MRLLAVLALAGCSSAPVPAPLDLAICERVYLCADRCGRMATNCLGTEYVCSCSKGVACVHAQCEGGAPAHLVPQ